MSIFINGVQSDIPNDFEVYQDREKKADLIVISQAEYDAKLAAGTLDEDSVYVTE